jgi:hypothetical protein
MTKHLRFFAVLFLLPVYLMGCADEAPTSDGYLPASAHLWTGVKIYFGEQRTYVFDVMGGNENYVGPSGDKIRGLKVRYPNGNEEWKDRNALIGSDQYWVKAEDPALKAERWEEFDAHDPFFTPAAEPTSVPTVTPPVSETTSAVSHTVIYSVKGSRNDSDIRIKYEDFSSLTEREIIVRLPWTLTLNSIHPSDYGRIEAVETDLGTRDVMNGTVLIGAITVDGVVIKEKKGRGIISLSAPISPSVKIQPEPVPTMTARQKKLAGTFGIVPEEDEKTEDKTKTDQTPSQTPPRSAPPYGDRFYSSPP